MQLTVTQLNTFKPKNERKNIENESKDLVRYMFVKDWDCAIMQSRRIYIYIMWQCVVCSLKTWKYEKNKMFNWLNEILIWWSYTYTSITHCFNSCHSHIHINTPLQFHLHSTPGLNHFSHVMWTNFLRFYSNCVFFSSFLFTSHRCTHIFRTSHSISFSCNSSHVFNSIFFSLLLFSLLIRQIFFSSHFYS